MVEVVRPQGMRHFVANHSGVQRHGFQRRPTVRIIEHHQVTDQFLTFYIYGLFIGQSQVGTVRPQQMAVAQLRTSAQHDTHVVYDAVVVRVQRRVLRKRIGKPSRHFAYEGLLACRLVHVVLITEFINRAFLLIISPLPAGTIGYDPAVHRFREETALPGKLPVRSLAEIVIYGVRPLRVVIKQLFVRRKRTLEHLVVIFVQETYETNQIT